MSEILRHQNDIKITIIQENFETISLLHSQLFRIVAEKPSKNSAPLFFEIVRALEQTSNARASGLRGRERIHANGLRERRSQRREKLRPFLGRTNRLPRVILLVRGVLVPRPRIRNSTKVKVEGKRKKTKLEIGILSQKVRDIRKATKNTTF